MTLDEIRKMVAEELAVADKASPGPWEFEPVLGGCIDGPDGSSFDDARFIARARTSVPALCAVADALLMVVGALPKCSTCGDCATRVVPLGGSMSEAHKCDRCAEVWAVHKPVDTRYAGALRALTRKP